MSRVIGDLHPDLQELAIRLQKLCNEKGLKIGIGECVRTVVEQDTLYAKGRTDKSSGKVTNAKGSTYSSMHQWFIAVDFYRNDGKGAYNDSDGFFTKVGKLGQSIGLEWGGSWKSYTDKPHFQLPNWGSTPTKLKQQFGTPEQFMYFWKLPTPVETVTASSLKSDIQWIQYHLNETLKATKGYVALGLDGDYGDRTKKAVLAYWKLLGWNKDETDDGSKAGLKTIRALASNRRI